MQDLKDYTQDVHYENFRKKKLLEGSPAYVIIEIVTLLPLTHSFPPLTPSPAGGSVM